MNERGKSSLLLFLVLLSLLLTYQLWFGQKPLEEMSEDAYEPVFFEEPRPLTGVVAPRSIILLQEEELYQFKYGDTGYRILWEWVAEFLLDTPFAEYRLMEERPAQGIPFITLSFSPALPTGQGSPWLKEGVQRELEEVIIMKETDSYWMELQSAGGDTVQLDIPRDEGVLLQERVGSLTLEDAVPHLELDAAELMAALDAEILLAEPLYVPAGTVRVEELACKEEELDQELLAKTFFVDRSLVRVIAERDGSMIYTDGEKGLHLSEGLVFSHPQLEQAPATYTYTASLNAASRLLSYYGGWPENLRLESIDRRVARGWSQDSLAACWIGYYRGRPILGDSGVLMIFNDSGLVEYRRKLYEAVYPAGDSYVARGYQEALHSALAVLRDNSVTSESGEPLILEDLVLGYAYDPDSIQSRMVPVWAIRISGIDLLLRAKDLSLLEEVAP